MPERTESMRSPKSQCFQKANFDIKWRGALNHRRMIDIIVLVVGRSEASVQRILPGLRSGFKESSGITKSGRPNTVYVLVVLGFRVWSGNPRLKS